MYIPFTQGIYNLSGLIVWQQTFLGQIDDQESAKRAGQEFGYPVMIKSRRLAYDGRGNAVAKSEKELTSAIDGMQFINLFGSQKS